MYLAARILTRSTASDHIACSVLALATSFALISKSLCPIRICTPFTCLNFYHPTAPTSPCNLRFFKSGPLCAPQTHLHSMRDMALSWYPQNSGIIFLGTTEIHILKTFKSKRENFLYPLTSVNSSFFVHLLLL